MNEGLSERRKQQLADGSLEFGVCICTSPAGPKQAPLLRAQVIFPWADLGGISKLSCNGLSIDEAGNWLLPFWMELGGAAACQRVPKLHGVAGVMISPDLVRAGGRVSVVLLAYF